MKIGSKAMTSQIDAAEIGVVQTMWQPTHNNRLANGTDFFAPMAGPLSVFFRYPLLFVGRPARQIMLNHDINVAEIALHQRS